MPHGNTGENAAGMTTQRRLTLVSNAFLYTSLPFVRMAVSFLTLPIMTRYLSPADYGIVNMLNMLIGLGGIFVLGLNASCCRFYFIYAEDQNAIKRLYSTNINFICAAMVLYGILLVAGSSFLSEKLFSHKLAFAWFIAAALQSLCININAITQNFLQIRHQGRHWFVNEAAGFVLQITVMLGLVLMRLGTFEAILLSGLLADGCRFLLSFRFMRPYYALMFDRAMFKQSFKYAWPSIPTSIIGYVYNYFDKVLVNRTSGLNSVGILDMSTRISAVLKYMMDGVDGVVSPLNLELITAGTAESLRKLADFNTKIIFMMLAVGFILVCGVREAVVLLTTPAFYFVAYVAPMYIFYHIFGILSFPAFWAIYHRTDLSYMKIIINSVFLVLSLGLNIWLIPRYGIMGAGVAIVIATFVTQTVQLMIGLRVTPIPLPLAKIALLYLMVIAGSVVVFMLTYFHTSFMVDIAFKAGLCAVFVASGFIMKIVSWSNVRDLAALIKMKMREKLSSGLAQAEG